MVNKRVTDELPESHERQWRDGRSEQKHNDNASEPTGAARLVGTEVGGNSNECWEDRVDHLADVKKHHLGGL